MCDNVNKAIIRFNDFCLPWVAQIELNFMLKYQITRFWISFSSGFQVSDSLNYNPFRRIVSDICWRYIAKCQSLYYSVFTMLGFSSFRVTLFWHQHCDIQGGQYHFCRKKCLYLFQFCSYTKILEYGKVWELYILFKLINFFLKIFENFT